MAETPNPFGTGDDDPPPVFAGRHEAITAAESAWRRAIGSGQVEAMFVFGTAGMGKSALLAELAARAVAQQWSPAIVRLERGDSARRSVLSGLAAAVDALYRRRPGATGMARMRDVVESAQANDGLDLGDVLVELGDAALDVGWGLVVLADDLQHGGDLSAVAAASARVAARGLPTAVIGACAPPGWLDDHRPLPMRPLTTAEITELVQVPAETRGRRFADDAVAAIEQLSGGCPRLVRTYARHTWAESTGPTMAASAVAAGRSTAEAALVDGFYGPRLSGLSGPERRFLQALTALGGSDVPVEAVARKLGDVNRFRPEDSQSARVRDALIVLGLVYTPDGHRLYAGLPELERFAAQALS